MPTSTASARKPRIAKATGTKQTASKKPTVTRQSKPAQPKTAQSKAAPKAGQPRKTKSATKPAGKLSARSRASASTPEIDAQAITNPIDELFDAYRKLSDALPPHGEAPVAEFDGRHIDIGERRVFVRQTPNFAPGSTQRQAVYVHGLGGSARNWTDLMYLMSPVAAGIALDLPGFGRSPWPDDADYSQRAHAQTVIDLIESQCDGPIDLFGNSMGGAISIRIAARRPDLVRSLTLISPALPTLRPQLSVAPLIAMTAPGIRHLAGQFVDYDDAEAAVERMHSLCYLDSTKIHESRRQIQIEETRWRLAQPNSSASLVGSARGLAKAFLPGPGNLWEYAKRVDSPTLAIFGTHDKLVDSRLADRAAATLPNAQVLTLHTGHVAQLEEPLRVAELVLQSWVQAHI